MKNKNRDKKKSDGMGFLPWTLIGFGLAAILSSALFIVLFEETSCSAIKIIFEVMKEIGIALMIAGGVTLLLELKEYQFQVIKRLSQVLIGEEYVDYLDDDQKEQAIKLLHDKLYFRGREEDPNSFFTFVFSKIIPILKECYYDDYTIIVECCYDEDKKRMIKKTKKRMVIINPIEDKNCEFEIPFGALMQKLGEEDYYRVNSCKVIDGKDIREEKVEITCKEVENDKNGYNVHYTGKLKLQVKKKIVVETETESIVPITDIYYNHKIVYPCRSYEMTFISTNPDYLVQGHGFSFWGDERKSDGLYKQTTDTSIIIKFTDWALPGDGVTMTILKREHLK